MKVFSAFLCAALCIGTTGAWAQWQWIDKDGRKVFSDRPPGFDIPDKNILKQPGGVRARAPDAAASAAASPASAAASAAKAAAAGGLKLSGKDSELEKKKKEAEAAEAAKEKEREEQNKRNMAESCARAKRTLASINSGVRLQTTNAKGEREVVNDADRAAEAKRVQGIVDNDCK